MAYSALIVLVLILLVSGGLAVMGLQHPYYSLDWRAAAYLAAGAAIPVMFIVAVWLVLRGAL